MKCYVWYWFGKDTSHYQSKNGKIQHSGGGPECPIRVPPMFPNLPDHDTEAELSPEDILALAKDFDVQILERDGRVTLHLDRKYGKHHQR